MRNTVCTKHGTHLGAYLGWTKDASDVFGAEVYEYATLQHITGALVEEGICLARKRHVLELTSVHVADVFVPFGTASAWPRKIFLSPLPEVIEVDLDLFL